MTDLAAPAPARDAHLHGLLMVFVAGVLYASAGLFARALPFDAWTLVAWRSLAGGLFTGLTFAVQSGRLSWRDYAMGPAHWVLVPVLAVATICYVAALKLTTVADVMIVYATTPFVTAAVAWLWNSERPSRRLMIASSIAMLGVVVMLGGAAGSPHRVAGAALTLVMNTGFAFVLVLARRYPARPTSPLNTLSLLLASAVSFTVAPAQSIDPRSFLLMIMFGVVTVGLAMQLFLAGARRAPSAEVALIGISDVALGPLMVFLAFGENPGTAAMLGGAIVMAALVWNIGPELRRLVLSRKHPI